MRMKFLSAAAVALLLAACSSNPDTTASTTNAGNTSPSGTTSGSTPSASITPGSARDFEVNVGDRVFFDYDKSDLSADAKATLDRQAAWLKTYSNVTLSVEGHADERGTREYNLALGERRANAVKSYLASSGIAASRLSTISYGKERPAVLGSTEASWAQNRRGVSVPQNVPQS